MHEDLKKAVATTPTKKRRSTRTALVGCEGEVVGRYQSGESARALAKIYGVGGTTVLRVLKEHGVEVRRTQPVGGVLTPQQEWAPDPAVESLSPAELAYIAGLIDGEGCLLIYRKKDSRGTKHYRCILRVSNTSRRVIEWLRDRFGGNARTWTKPGGGGLPVYHWPIEGPRMAQLLVAARPYFVIKPELADLLVEMQRSMSYSSTGNRLPVEIREQRDDIFARYQKERLEMKGR